MNKTESIARKILGWKLKDGTDGMIMKKACLFMILNFNQSKTLTMQS